jgi:hypothetical protein
MFDYPPADLEVSNDLYRIDVLCYGQAGFPDDILDFSDERKKWALPALLRQFSLLVFPTYFFLL